VKILEKAASRFIKVMGEAPSYYEELWMVRVEAMIVSKLLPI